MVWGEQTSGNPFLLAEKRMGSMTGHIKESNFLGSWRQQFLPGVSTAGYAPFHIGLSGADPDFTNKYISQFDLVVF